MQYVLPGIAGTLGLAVAVVYAIRKTARERISEPFSSPRRLWLLPLLLLVYCGAVAALAGRPRLDSWLTLGLYFFLPTLVLYARGRTSESGGALLLDFAVVLLLWLPIELRWVQKSIAIVGAPESVSILGLDVRPPRGYPLGILAATLYGLIAFTGWRRLDLHCDWAFGSTDGARTRRELALVAVTLLALMALILPPSLAIGFTRLNPNPELAANPVVIPFLLLGLFFTPAFVEEFAFRGLIQNLLCTRLAWIPSLAMASVIFGLSHVENKAGGFSFPNWPYVAFATIAGLGYGFVYHRTRSLVASSLLHALVDFIWLLFFKAPKGA